MNCVCMMYGINCLGFTWAHERAVDFCCVFNWSIPFDGLNFVALYSPWWDIPTTLTTVPLAKNERTTSFFQTNPCIRTWFVLIDLVSGYTKYNKSTHADRFNKYIYMIVAHHQGIEWNELKYVWCAASNMNNSVPFWGKKKKMYWFVEKILAAKREKS